MEDDTACRRTVDSTDCCRKYTLQGKTGLPDGKEGDVIEIPLVVKGKWYQTIWAYIMYVLLLGGLSYFFYSYFRKKDHRKQIHRDREMILKENLNLEKLKQEQKKEIEAMRNRLLMLFVAGIAYAVVTHHRSAEGLTEG